MKKKIKIRVSTEKILELVGEKYDEFTYLISMKTKENKQAETTRALCDYRLVDILTGLSVAAKDDKEELIKAYQEKYNEYMQFRNSKSYNDRISEYNELCGGVKND